MARDRIGVWLVGARGNVASTAIVGLTALKKGLIETTGLVSELPAFAGLELADWKQMVVGGHDIRDTTLLESAMRMHDESRALDERLINRCKNDLAKIDENVRPGTVVNVGATIRQLASPAVRRRKETPLAAVQRIQSDLKSFVKEQGLDRLILVNLASTEPPTDDSQWPSTWDKLEPWLEKPRKCPLPASSLYAIAALDLGYPYVNFTPSLGSVPAAINDLAVQRETCHAGRDGKTGETLLKSTLAPMFAHRNLHVMSWVGHNIFGNMDGKVLDDPINKATKVSSKDKLLGRIFGYHPQSHVSIEYIASLGDWKTAWDHVHFRGFLGTPMTFQFLWQGCDSLLAAPLVLDLVRLTDCAHRHGTTGALGFLASFFKSPQGSDVDDFAAQFETLLDWADDAMGQPSSARQTH